MDSVKGEREEQQAPVLPSKTWHSYISEDLPRSFKESTDSAVRSARSFQDHSFSFLRSLQDLIPEVKSKFDRYEDAFFGKFRDGLTIGREHPAMTVGISLATVFLLVPGPRRFLLRHTVGRLQSEEARFVKAENNVKMLNISVDVMKKESRKLLDRATFAEKEMRNGQIELKNAGKQIQGLSKSVSHVEAQAAELMDLLREIPGREALRLRAEVASVASLLRQQRSGLTKTVNQLSDLGVPV